MRKYLQNLTHQGCEELSGGLGPYPSKSQDLEEIPGDNPVSPLVRTELRAEQLQVHS